MKRLMISVMVVTLIAAVPYAATRAVAMTGGREMQINVDGFEGGQRIPDRYTCVGRNISPRVTWQDAPADTKSFALVVDDPDAPSGIWVHWVIYNIPAEQRELPADIDGLPQLPDGTLQGQNSFRRIGYGGPCPPQGHGAHRYFFRLYALDSVPDMKSGLNRTGLDKAMKGHILDSVSFMGRYER